MEVVALVLQIFGAITIFIASTAILAYSFGIIEFKFSEEKED